MAYDAKVNYMDVLGSTKYWDILIYNFLRSKNIVIPQKTKSEKPENPGFLDQKILVSGFFLGQNLRNSYSSTHVKFVHSTPNIREVRFK